MYDYYLGGKDNYAVDREAAEKVIATTPAAPVHARANRAFLGRVVRMLAGEAGIDQFIDIGCGLPTQDNVHQVAQRVRADARVLYVDNDPLVISHGKALLATDPQTRIINADLRDPDSILRHPGLDGLIDLTLPVGVLFMSVLHCVPDDEQVRGLIWRFRDTISPGSHIAISHISLPTSAPGHAEGARRGAQVYTDVSASTSMTFRDEKQLAELFDGLDVIEPGLVGLADWRPDPVPGDLSSVGGATGIPSVNLCGVGRR